MSNESHIRGGRELDALLRTLAPKLQKNIMRSALRAGAAVYRDAVRQNVPVHLGPLKRSVRITSNTKKGIVRAAVKVGNKEAWYGPLVEYGTDPHIIKAHNGGALRFGEAVVAEVEHPGSEEQPFMRPAADENHAAALDAVISMVRKRLTREGLEVPAPEVS